MNVEISSATLIAEEWDNGSYAQTVILTCRVTLVRILWVLYNPCKIKI